jgi:hypothetical protein
VSAQTLSPLAHNLIAVHRAHHAENGQPLRSSTTLSRNDVYVRNGSNDSFAVVVEEHHNNGEVRWVNHPVPVHTTAGRSAPVDRFLREYTPVDRDSDLALAVVQGASSLVAKLPAPTRWGY